MGHLSEGADGVQVLLARPVVQAHFEASESWCQGCRAGRVYFKWMTSVLVYTNLGRVATEDTEGRQRAQRPRLKDLDF